MICGFGYWMDGRDNPRVRVMLQIVWHGQVSQIIVGSHGPEGIDHVVGAKLMIMAVHGEIIYTNRFACLQRDSIAEFTVP